MFLDTFGRPAVVGATVLLVGWLALVAGLALIVGRVVGLPALGAGLLPISVGYLIAHYLTYLLFDGQRIVGLLNDPLNRGATLLGIGRLRAEPAVAAGRRRLGDPARRRRRRAHGRGVGRPPGGGRGGDGGRGRRGTGPRRPATARAIRLRQLPLAALMVGLTSLTLWSLGQVIVEHT